MDVFSGTRLVKMVDSQPKKFQKLLPSLVKRLILSSSHCISGIRMPSRDDIWAPGFDGIVENAEATTYVCAGKSVWELGTNNDSLKKINDDWEKRNKDSLGVEKEDTEFYFVMPRIWAFDSFGWPITKWEKEHQYEWKKIHVYDATILSDWINMEPAVCAWLLEQFEEEENIDFTTVSKAWERFSSKTSPAFSHSLFLEGRSIEGKILLDRVVANDSSPVRVKADTTVDAMGFCLSVFQNNVDFANTVIVINNQTTYLKLSRLCNNKLFLLNFPLDCDVVSGNKAIICFNKEDQTVKVDVVLRPLTKATFNKAIKDMSIPEREKNDLYGNTHGNLLSLIRKIPGNSSMTVPKWANQDDIRLLASILLLREYDTHNESDCNLVSFLAAEKYDVLLEKYNKWLCLEDAPIKRVEDHIVLINYEEAWQVLQLDTDAPIFSRLLEAICSIVSNHCAENGGLCYIDYRTKRHIGNLIINLVYFSYNESEKERIEQSVKDILAITPFPSVALEYLSLLSEAAPQSVMDFLARDYSQADGLINSAFSNDIYDRDYCKVLFALDELVLHEETRVQACDFLCDLCLNTRNRKYAISNSPRESLLTALCLWSDHTILTINDKVALIKRYLSIDEDFFVPFVIDLLLKDTVILGSRSEAKALPPMPIYTHNLYNAINELGFIVFSKCIESHRIDGLKKLLQGYRHFYIDTLISASKLFSIADYSLDEIVPLNSEVRERAYFASRNDESKPWGPALETWIMVTTPIDVIGQVGWLFHDYYHCYSFELVEIDDLEKGQKALESKRIEILKKLSIANSTERIKLIRCSKDIGSWGAFYAQQLPSTTVKEFANESFRLGKRNILYGILDYAKKEDCISILDSLSKNDQCFALQNMHRRDIMEWLDTEEKEKAYWCNQRMFDYDSETYSKLLIYNPLELLSYYSYCKKTPLRDDAEKIIQIFTAILAHDTITLNNHYIYEIDEILSKLDAEGYYSETWVKTCATLFERNLLAEYPNVLKKYYFENPLLLCEAVINITEKTYSEFNLYYDLPLSAYNDSYALNFFIKTFIDNCSRTNLVLTTLGSILGKGPSGTDGLFPHEIVRNALETYRDYNLSHYVLIGKLNSRGVKTVEDGSTEKEYAKQLKKEARQIEISYPETARLLRWLSDNYSEEGKHDYLDSEIDLNAW